MNLGSQHLLCVAFVTLLFVKTAMSHDLGVVSHRGTVFRVHMIVDSSPVRLDDV